MKALARLLSLVILLSSIAVAQEKRFKRIETCPQGDQTSFLKKQISIVSGNVNLVEYISDAPYERAWPAIKRATRTFARESRRPVVGIDEDNSVVQNGKITQDRAVGAQLASWQDQFFAKAIRQGGKTKIQVTRKVVMMEMDGNIKMQYSNGKYENYLLTLIEDEITKGGADDDPEVKADTRDYSKSAPGKYVNRDNGTEYIELKPDGSFFLRERGSSFTGKYEVSGNTITIMVGSGQAARARFKGDTIEDDLGKIWVKKGGESVAPAPAPQAPSQAPSTEVLTNAEVMRMSKAGLPDSVIIGKIKSSRCRFDTSTDGLIKLKQAGLSNAVIQAMTEAPSR